MSKHVITKFSDFVNESKSEKNKTLKIGDCVAIKMENGFNGYVKIIKVDGKNYVGVHVRYADSDHNSASYKNSKFSFTDDHITDKVSIDAESTYKNYKEREKKGQVMENKTLPTQDEYLNNAKNELGEMHSTHMDGSIKDEYYREIEKHIKSGGKISDIIYNSLDSGKQYHFNKHYNYRGDKVEKTSDVKKEN